MKISMVLLVLTGLMQAGCAPMSTTNQGESMASRYATCAMCGASVTPGYFSYTSERGQGPSRGW